MNAVRMTFWTALTKPTEISKCHKPTDLTV